MRFSILGPLEVHDGDRLVAVGRGRQRMLLAILLLNAEQVVSTDRLVDALWGEHPPETAAKALQGYVSQLRKLLGADAVVTASSGYLLHVAENALDAARFDKLVEESRTAEPPAAAAKLRDALAMWRGPALADFSYDEFAQREIRRLEERRFAALEARIDADLACGQGAELVGELKALATEHPLRERIHAQLMIALYRAGRQSEALDVFQTIRGSLVDELGIEPGAELQRVQQAVLGHDPALGAPTRVSSEAVVRSPRRWVLAAAGLLLVIGAIVAAVVELTGSGARQPHVVPNSVAAIDPTSGRVVADIPVGARPVAAAYGNGSLWVASADDSTVARIDLKRRTASFIGVGGDLAAVTAAFGSVWVAGGNDATIARIDPGQNAVVQRISLASRNLLVPDPVFFVSSDASGIWATRGTDLVRLDPESGAPGRPTPVGAVYGLTTGDGAVWVSTLDEALNEVQPSSVRISDRTLLPNPGFTPVVFRGSVWVVTQLGGSYVVLGVDTGTLTTSGTVHTRLQPTALMAAGGRLWAALADGTVVRIDTTTATVRTVARLGRSISSLALGGGYLWATATAAPLRGS